MSSSRFSISIAAWLTRRAPWLPPKINNVNFSSFATSGSVRQRTGLPVSTARARKILRAAFIRGEHAVGDLAEHLIGKAGPEVLLHDRGADTQHFRREQQ